MDRSQMSAMFILTVTPLGLQSLATRFANHDAALGLFQAGGYPWSLSLADLDALTDLLPTPATFLHYATRRLQVERTPFSVFADELGHVRRARAIDPTQGADPTQELLALGGLRRYDEALSVCQNLPQRGLMLSLTAYVLFQLGRPTEARTKLQESLKEKLEDPGGWLNAIQALLFAVEGKETEAEEQIRQAAEKKGFGHFHHSAFAIACAYARMNKPHQAIDWLEQAADQGYPCYPAFERDPNLEPLRMEPRFIAFLARMKQEWDYYRALPSATADVN